MLSLSICSPLICVPAADTRSTETFPDVRCFHRLHFLPPVRRVHPVRLDVRHGLPDRHARSRPRRRRGSSRQCQWPGLAPRTVDVWNLGKKSLGPKTEDILWKLYWLKKLFNSVGGKALFSDYWILISPSLLWHWLALYHFLNFNLSYHKIGILVA